MPRALAFRLPLLAAATCLALAACRHALPTARPAFRDYAEAACAPLPRARAAEAGIAQSALDSLQSKAVAMQSDALVVLRGGQVVHEWTRPGFRMPFNPQSVTKAIAGLGVGVLLDNGRLPSLDLRLSTLFPEFAATDKQPVTLRMLMNHTSGLAAARGEAQFADQPDVGRFVRTRAMVEPAATTFRYSNVGAQLVSQVVQARTAAPLHTLLDSAVFGPMCIRDWSWHTDAEGATYSDSRLFITALDLAKLGQLVLDGGNYRGRQLLRPATIDTLTAIHGGPVAGLGPFAYVGLWQYWGGDSLRLDQPLLERLQAVPVSDSLQSVVRRVMGTSRDTSVLTFRLRAALDSTFGVGKGVPRWYAETRGALFPQRWRTPAQAVGHSGSWGQWLLVFPETQTVVVRFSSWENPGRKSEEDGNNWDSIVSDAYRLVGRRTSR